MHAAVLPGHLYFVDLLQRIDELGWRCNSGLSECGIRRAGRRGLRKSHIGRAEQSGADDR